MTWRLSGPIFYYLEEERLVIARLWDTRQDPTKFFVPDTP